MEGLRIELKREEVTVEKAQSILGARLRLFKVDARSLERGFSVRPNEIGESYGFSVALYIKDDDGVTRAMQFDFPERSWRGV